MEVGTSEAEPIWTEFLRKLTRRGLRGVKLVVYDAHEGLKPPSPRCSARPGSAVGWAVEEPIVGGAMRKPPTSRFQKLPLPEGMSG